MHFAANAQRLALGQDLPLLGDARQQFLDRNRDTLDLRPADLKPGHRHRVAQQRHEALRRALDAIDVAALLGCQAGHSQQLRHSEHDIERIADFMAHHGDEVGLGAA